MSNQLHCFIIDFSLLPFACNRERQQQYSFDFKSPSVVEANAYRLSPERKAPPKFVRVTKVKRKVAGNREALQMKSGIFLAKAKRIIFASVAKRLIPDDTFYVPLDVPGINRPSFARPSQIIMLEETCTNENYPGNFSQSKESLSNGVLFLQCSKTNLVTV